MCQIKHAKTEFFPVHIRHPVALILYATASNVPIFAEVFLAIQYDLNLR